MHVISEPHDFDAVTTYTVSISLDSRGTREGKNRIDDVVRSGAYGEKSACFMQYGVKLLGRHFNILGKRYCVHKESGNKPKANGSSIGHHSFGNVLLQNIKFFLRKNQQHLTKAAFYENGE